MTAKFEIDDPSIDLEALEERIREAGLDPASPLLRRLLALVDQLLGFPRHLSQHVGGFLISEQPLTELVPVENAAMKDRTVIQWDKDDLEELNLFKVDLLGLGALHQLLCREPGTLDARQDLLQLSRRLRTQLEDLRQILF